MKKRIENLEFDKATYLGEVPVHPSYNICKWTPNIYYKREQDFRKDGNYYRYKDPKYDNCRIHKNCFKHPETRYVIASFVYDEHEDFYELHFIGDRPLELDNEELVTFWELLKYGNQVLNNNEDA